MKATPAIQRRKNQPKRASARRDVFRKRRDSFSSERRDAAAPKDTRARGHARDRTQAATPTLATLDARSNALTEEAGRRLSLLLDAAPHIRTLCGVRVASLRRADMFRELALGPDLDASRPLRVGDRVEARFRGRRRFYPAIITAVRGPAGDELYDVDYVDESDDDRVVQREQNRERRMVRPAAAGPPRRLEAGGCLILAEALKRAGSGAKETLTAVRLPRQALAFDLSHWDPPPQPGDALGGDRQSRAHETGVNARPLRALLDALAAFPRVEVVDIRDSLDPGAAAGEALADCAVERNWTALGLGGCLLDPRALLRDDGDVRVRGQLKDAGVAAVARLAAAARSLRVSTTAVSSGGLARLLDLAEARPGLQRVNGLDLDEFRVRGPELRVLDLSGARLDRASTRMVLKLLDHCVALDALDLSNADLMPSAHPHPMTPELFGSGHLCNACASHHVLSVDLNLACQVCDNDMCGAAWRSNDIVDDLADALARRGATLKRLTLRSCCFGVMDGPIAARPFEHLGDVLRDDLVVLEHCDLSGNEWSAPRLTRWCAESLTDAGGDASSGAPDDDEDEAAAEARWRHHAQQWRSAVEADSESDGDDAAERQRANYSRTRIPLAAGFPALAAGLARRPSLLTVAVSDRRVLDCARLRTAAADAVDADACFLARPPPGRTDGDPPVPAPEAFEEVANVRRPSGNVPVGPDAPFERTAPAV